MQIEHVLAAQNELGEGPLWDYREQALYWVDLLQGRLFRLHPASGQLERFEVGLPIGCLALRAAGGLAMATRDGFALWDPATRELRLVADPEANRPDNRFNDGAVDPQGRFWAGTMGKGPVGSLYRLDPDGSVHQMETGVTTSNGIGWSPDGRAMYYTDSPLHVIYAYDFDPASGEIANRRPFAHTPDEEGVPDGLTVDSEGCVWSARWGGWKVTRYDPAGQVERVIRTPVQYPTSCAFGGPNLDELYVTSAWIMLNEAERQQRPLDGDLFRIHPGVQGMPASLFGG